MKKISLISSCYNEVELIEEFEERIMNELKIYENKYEYEIIVIDNNSNDGTIEKLRKISKENIKFKVILCTKNFRSERTVKHALKAASGDLIIQLSSDLEQPTSLIHDFVKKWENGSKITFGHKIGTNESKLLKILKKYYYKTLVFLSDEEIPINTEGFMFDKSVKNELVKIYDPNAFLRGTTFELFQKYDLVKFEKEVRKKGHSKSNINYLFSYGTETIFKMSLKPLRIIIMIGFIMSFFSFLTGIFYLMYKLFYWDSFSLGIAPLIIGVFFILSIIITMIGILGQYIIILVSYTKKLPNVIEEERINF